MNHIYMQEQFGENWFTYPNLYTSVVNYFSDGSHFVEVGSWKGKSSAFMAVEIINSGKKIKFDCIDTWEGGPEHKHMDNSKLYELFIANMQPLEKYYTPIKSKSVEASRLYKDESLDFVFIDACHEYECVIEDIKAWHPKVKKNGILAGHDYVYTFPGVMSAVNELIGVNNIQAFENCWIHKIL